MASDYQIFNGGGDIVFLRSDERVTSTVCVKNLKHRLPLAEYTFHNIPSDTFQSPYISWANLNCCGGWSFDESYLLTAVQDGKKLCAGITMNSEEKLQTYLDSLSGEYPHFCPPPMQNGPYTFYYVDVTRKGCISDYIDMNAVQETYSALRVKFLDFSVIREYTSMPMIHLLDGTVEFDYANPNGSEQLAVTGLLLGYPIESTSARF